MNARLARRQAALAAVALVGALGAIALSRLGDDSDAAPPPTATAGWETAQVSVFEPSAEPTACGIVVDERAVGIAHPVLPCGAKVLVEHQGRQAAAEVVERGPVDTGVAFELSPGLAGALGVAGTATVRWRFAE
jgi:Lytic transglycolase